MKVIPVELGDKAKLLSQQSDINSNKNSVSSTPPSGHRTETTQHSYETETEIVVITIIMFFAPNGDLIDVQVLETRFGKPAPDAPDAP